MKRIFRYRELDFPLLFNTEHKTVYIYSPFTGELVRSVACMARGLRYNGLTDDFRVALEHECAEIIRHYERGLHGLRENYHVDSVQAIYELMSFLPEAPQEA